jgi:hypothetical protein
MEFSGEEIVSCENQINMTYMRVCIEKELLCWWFGNIEGDALYLYG